MLWNDIINPFALCCLYALSSISLFAVSEIGNDQTCSPLCGEIIYVTHALMKFFTFLFIVLLSFILLLYIRYSTIVSTSTFSYSSTLLVTFDYADFLFESPHFAGRNSL